MAFNHEVVPDYLRTKPDPEVDDKMMQFQTRANQTTPEMLQVSKRNNIINTSELTAYQFSAIFVEVLAFHMILWLLLSWVLSALLYSICLAMFYCMI